jgi:RimJ/RimL family protein N-acetyltransferase
MKVAFEVDKVERVEIHCDPRNVRSAAVPRKLGYTHDATLRSRLHDTDGQPRDSMVWSLLAAEYAASPSTAVEIEVYDAAGRRIL